MAGPTQEDVEDKIQKRRIHWGLLEQTIGNIPPYNDSGRA